LEDFFELFLVELFAVAALDAVTVAYVGSLSITHVFWSVFK